jgi:mannosyltransferase OCH1-like enzyme
MLAETWKNLHPDWGYKLWTDAMNRNFIQDNYPGFLKKYDAFPREIQRVDAIRYFILLKEGGVYVDIDFECFENISGLLLNETCVIGKEPKEHCERFSKDLILCNAFMAATAQNKFIEFICDKVIAHPFKQTITNNEVLESTGPFILTEAYKQYNKKSQIKFWNQVQYIP